LSLLICPESQRAEKPAGLLKPRRLIFPLVYNDLRGIGLGHLKGWVRQADNLLPIVSMLGWKSPRLGVRFGLDEKELCLYHPNGKRFASYLEIAKRVEAAEAEIVRLKALLAQQNF
jgi:hypothetical protein